MAGPPAFAAALPAPVRASSTPPAHPAPRLSAILAATRRNPHTGSAATATETPALHSKPHTARSFRAPPPSSTQRQRQYGASSAAKHVPAQPCVPVLPAPSALSP